MRIFHCGDYLNCPNYDHGDYPLVEIMTANTGRQIEFRLAESEIVFTRKGRFKLSFDKVENQEVVAGKILLFPAGSVIKVCFDKPSELLICRLRNPLEICEKYRISDLYKEKNILSDRLIWLDFNERIDHFVKNFIVCIEDGLCCRLYFETKIQEMLHLFRAYYPQEQLALFFMPLRNSSTAFSSFVLRHYTEMKNVKEFADFAGYSLSGFGKRFRAVFGTSPSVWLKQKKSQRIYHDIKTSTKPFKQLCEEYEFSSPSHFSDFCKKIFGIPPGKIRGKTNA